MVRQVDAQPKHLKMRQPRIDKHATAGSLLGNGAGRSHLLTINFDMSNVDGWNEFDGYYNGWAAAQNWLA